MTLEEKNDAYNELLVISNTKSIEEKLDTAEFMRCHKSYIINLSMITQLEVYGRWTYTVKLKGTDATALMTSQKYEEIKQMYE